jgi:O-antigen/teichoic acid export membrane protein
VWYKQNPALLWHRQRWLALAFLATASGLFAILFPIRHTLVSLVLGEQFVLSVAPFGMLLAAKLLSLVTGIFSLGLLAVGREDVFCFCLIGAVTTLVIANYVLVPTFGAVAAAAVSLIAECLLLCATAFFGWRESRTSVV